MAVTSSKLIGDEFTLALKGQNTAQLTWRVHSDDYMNSAQMLSEALTASPDPVLATGTYIGNGCFVLNLSAKLEHQQNAKQWVVTADCGPWPSDQGSPDGGVATEGIVNHPLARKVVWWAERMTEQEPVEKDYNGLLIVNSAGKTFDEPLMRDRYLTVFVGQKNFATLSAVLDLNDQYDNTVNSDTTLGRPSYTMRYLGAEISQPQYENNIEFYTATFRIAYRKEQWYVPLVNRGWGYYLTPKTEANARYIDAVDGQGQPVSEPVLLKADGTLLPKDGTPTTNSWLVYTPVSYASLIADPVYP